MGRPTLRTRPDGPCGVWQLRAMRSVTLLMAFAAACTGAGPVDGGVGGADGPPVDAAGRPDAGCDCDASGDAARPDGGTTDAGGSRIDDIVALLAASPADVAAIDAALHDVAWSDGWPLREGRRWLFVTELATSDAVHWVSDLNAWDAGSHPATRSATGRHHWVVVEEARFLSPPEGSKYKWVLGASEYLPPLEATAYGFDAFGRFGWVRPPPSAPHLEQFPGLASAHLALPRTLRVYLPAGFVPRGPSAARARTLLVHDGQNVFHPDAFFGGWRLDEALSGPAFSDVVVLAIDNAADRMDAYTHVADDIGAGSRVGGRAAAYLALLEDEALPFLRARYGVEARGDSLAMMGSSLGGLVTAFAALERPELFGCGAALSPTLGWGSFAPGMSDALVQRWPSHGRGATALYLDSGGGVVGACADLDGDGVEDDADDRDNYCVTVQLRDRLVDLGYAFGVDLAHWHAPGAGHDEAAWAARVPRALAACSAMGWAAP